MLSDQYSRVNIKKKKQVKIFENITNRGVYGYALITISVPPPPPLHTHTKTNLKPGSGTRGDPG